jgi:GNAT superfamily N-acetyltransferase
MVEIHPVENRRERDEFVKLPRSIYPQDSPWVRPPDMVVNGYLDRRNPFFQNGVGEAFIVRREGKAVGRIMAHVWRRHHRLHGERVGYFGFFECENDSEAATLLLETAAKFVRRNNCSVLRGPFNMTGAQEAGIVTDGFDKTPAVDMVYTALWYPALLEKTGFQKCLEMQTRSNDNITSLNPDAVAARYRNSPVADVVKLRCLSSLHRNAEMEMVRDVVNASFLGNWGFVPINRQEWELQTGALLPILDPALVILATVQDIAVGVTLAVPDFNRVFRKTGGRLFHPASLALFGKSKLKEVVVILCAVRKQYQGLGIGRLLNAELLRSMLKSGYESLSTTWIGGENTASLASTDAFGMTCRHSIALYERAV